MAYKSNPVTLATSDTDIIEVGVGKSAVVVLGIHNVNGSARTLTLKYYKQSTDETTTFVSGLSCTANSSIKLPAPFSMQAGDKLIGLASNSSSLIVTPFITDSDSAPAAQGWTPRGAYSSGATYATNDYVSLNGNVYYSMQDGNTGHDPEMETDWWMAGPEKGPAGDGDVTGPNGGVTDGHAVVLDGTSGKQIKSAGAKPRLQGKETIWIPASAMIPRMTNGAGAGSAEMTTNKNMVKTLDFDTATQEFAQFEISMPKSWNLGTLTFQPIWSHPSTTTNFGVVWGLQAVARSDDDALDVAFGTEQTSTDTGGTTNDLYVGSESSAITVAGSPAAGDVVQFQIKRNVSDGSDNMAVDARLHGIRLYYTVNAADDA